MLEILNKKEALKKMMEGEQVYTTYNFKEYIEIEKIKGYALKDEQYASGKRLFFVIQTKDDAFKTVNNVYLKIERVTWEKLRDVYLNYIKGLPIGDKRFLLEDEPLWYSEVWGEGKFEGLTYEWMCKYKNTNIYMFEIKKGGK